MSNFTQEIYSTSLDPSFGVPSESSLIDLDLFTATFKLEVDPFLLELGIGSSETLGLFAEYSSWVFVLTIFALLLGSPTVSFSV